MNVTIKDVARAANVSVATVSRVLNKKTNVSPGTADTVRSAIEKLGYNPSFQGRDLRKNEAGRILVVTATIRRDFYTDVLEGIEQAALAEGFDIIVAPSHDDPAHEMRLLGMLFTHSADGVILLAPKSDAKTISGLADSHNVAVCLERVEHCKALTVTIDNIRAGKDATSYLIGKGHKKIAMISAETRSQSSTDREIGYLQALKDNDIPYNEQYVYYGDYGNESGAEGCEALLNLKNPPTAIFCASDMMAIGAVRAAAKQKRKVGKDILIFGFGNIPFSRIFTPHISTVEHPRVLQGRIVTEKLIQNIKSGMRDNGLYILPHSLILRETTGD